MTSQKKYPPKLTLLAYTCTCSCRINACSKVWYRDRAICESVTALTSKESITLIYTDMQSQLYTTLHNTQMYFTRRCTLHNASSHRHADALYTTKINADTQMHITHHLFMQTRTCTLYNDSSSRHADHAHYSQH